MHIIVLYNCANFKSFAYLFLEYVLIKGWKTWKLYNTCSWFMGMEEAATFLECRRRISDSEMSQLNLRGLKLLRLNFEKLNFFVCQIFFNTEKLNWKTAIENAFNLK